MAKKRKKAQKNSQMLEFGPRRPGAKHYTWETLPEDLQRRLKQAQMSGLGDLVRNTPGKDLTQEQRQMVMDSMLDLLEAHQLITGSDTVTIRLPEGVSPSIFGK